MRHNHIMTETRVESSYPVEALFNKEVHTKMGAGAETNSPRKEMFSYLTPRADRNLYFRGMQEGNISRSPW